MIDLDKEREAFEIHLNYMTDRVSSAPFYMENGNYVSSIINSMWSIWEKRAKLAQSEINKEREQATEYYVDCEHLKAEITELKREIAYLNNARKDSNGYILSANSEITELKQKLARYENPEYVLVPRKPNKKILSKIDTDIRKANFINAYSQDSLEKSIPLIAYKAIIEAVEKEYAN